MRRHANAENVWVTCRVDPYAFLRAADDRTGMDSPQRQLRVGHHAGEGPIAEANWRGTRAKGRARCWRVVLQPAAAERLGGAPMTISVSPSSTTMG